MTSTVIDTLRFSHVAYGRKLSSSNDDWGEGITCSQTGGDDAVGAGFRVTN
jgi:hypothetical protein